MEIKRFANVMNLVRDCWLLNLILSNSKTQILILHNV